MDRCGRFAADDSQVRQAPRLWFPLALQKNEGMGVFKAITPEPAKQHKDQNRTGAQEEYMLKNQPGSRGLSQLPELTST